MSSSEIDLADRFMSRSGVNPTCWSEGTHTSKSLVFVWRIKYEWLDLQKVCRYSSVGEACSPGTILVKYTGQRRRATLAEQRDLYSYYCSLIPSAPYSDFAAVIGHNPVYDPKT